MSKKKSTVEDKRQKLIEIFFEKSDFLSLKEVEKFAIKQKSIPPMLVKQILQSLVDDDLVTCDKIGSSNYYWAFPSEAIKLRDFRLQEIIKVLENQNSKLNNIEIQLSQIKDMQPGESKEFERDQLLSKTIEKERAVNELTKEIKALHSVDPESLNNYALDAQKFKENANALTDNIFAILSWAKEKNPTLEDREIMQHIGAPECVDFLD